MTLGTRSRIGNAGLLGLLALGLMMTTAGWGESLTRSERPLGMPIEALFRLVLAAGVISLAGGQIATAWRLRHEEAEILRMRQELGFARRMQERFLPQELPVVPNLDLWGANLSSHEVSGDYYDIRGNGDGRPLVLAIADVSGKGVPAALLMSAVQATLHSHILQGRFDLERSMENLNRLVYQDVYVGRFVTMFLAEFDAPTRRLRYVRAGHDYPLIVSRDGTVRRLKEGNVFLGLLPDAKYEATTIDLDPDDTLCLYTDGVTEATDTHSELFGEERLVDVLIRHRGEPAPAIGRAILDAVSAHTGLRRQTDDVTLVIARVLEPRLAHNEGCCAPLLVEEARL